MGVVKILVGFWGKGTRLKGKKPYISSLPILFPFNRAVLGVVRKVDLIKSKFLDRSLAIPKP